MNKSLILAGLLLPFSGYAITKEERKEQIVTEIRQIEANLLWIQDIIKHNFWITFISGDEIRTEVNEARGKLLSLQAELNKIEAQQREEFSCIKS